MIDGPIRDYEVTIALSRCTPNLEDAILSQRYPSESFYRASTISGKFRILRYADLIN